VVISILSLLRLQYSLDCGIIYCQTYIHESWIGGDIRQNVDKGK